MLYVKHVSAAHFAVLLGQADSKWGVRAKPIGEAMRALRMQHERS